MVFFIYDEDLDRIEGYKDDRARAEERAMEFSNNSEDVRFAVMIPLPVMKFPELRVLSIYLNGIEEYRTDRYDEDIREQQELEAQGATF